MLSHRHAAGKMCNAKQSIRRVFAKSERAADIRGVVQSLNTKRGEEQAAAEDGLRQHQLLADESSEDNRAQIVPKERSAWGVYVSSASRSSDEEDSGDAGETVCTTQWEHAAKAQRESRKVRARAYGLCWVYRLFCLH